VCVPSDPLLLLLSLPLSLPESLPESESLSEPDDDEGVAGRFFFGLDQTDKQGQQRVGNQ